VLVVVYGDRARARAWAEMALQGEGGEGGGLSSTGLAALAEVEAGLGFGVGGWGMGFEVWGLGIGVWGLGLGGCCLLLCFGFWV
jgi:hypothetical protein